MDIIFPMQKWDGMHINIGRIAMAYTFYSFTVGVSTQSGNGHFGRLYVGLPLHGAFIP